MKTIYIRHIIMFALLAALINVIFFFGLDAEEIIFSGDQFFRFNANEAFTKSFFLRKSSDFGVLNGWQFITEFWDSIYYQVIYLFEISPKLAEILLFYLVLFLSMFLSFLGFNELAKYFGIKSDPLIVYLIVIWYCFNPYTLALWHGGVYNLGSSLTYSLAPLIFFQFNKAIFSATNKIQILICALLIAIASFTFWLVAPLVIFLILYFIFKIAFQIKLWRIALANIIYFLLFYVPLVSFILFGILHEFYNNAGDNNETFSPNFGNLQGGIWYQLGMIFSWGIYTVWYKRSLYPFGDYFFSLPYITGIVLLYVIVIFGLLFYFTKSRQEINGGNSDSLISHIQTYFNRALSHFIRYFEAFESNLNNRLRLFSNYVRSKQNNNFRGLGNLIIRIKEYIKLVGPFCFKCIEVKRPNINKLSLKHTIISLCAIFVCSVFLAKGAQDPWGHIFLWLYNNIPFFVVFRTPDIRFGFLIILSLALLLLFVSQYYRRIIIILAVILFTALQAWPLFSGIAVKGSNINEQYYDRILQIPKNYKNISSFINQYTTVNEYVLTIPSVSYGHYVLPNDDHLIGQDLLPKLIDAPFLYVSSSGGMSKNTYNLLNEIISNEQYERLKDFPIKYVLLRNDICPTCQQASMEKLGKVADLVYQDATFFLYQVKSYRPIVDAPKISYKKVSPIKYRVTFRNVSKPNDLYFLQSFNKNWKLFSSSNQVIDCNNLKTSIQEAKSCDDNKMTLLQLEDWKYLWKPPLFESSHQVKLGYANGWFISPDEIKSKVSNSDYTVNNDGSLNFTLTIYYQPQIWYVLFGLLVVVLTVISLCVLLLRYFKTYKFLK